LVLALGVLIFLGAVLFSLLPYHFPLVHWLGVGCYFGVFVSGGFFVYSLGLLCGWWFLFVI
jgi:hypothetical protein